MNSSIHDFDETRLAGYLQSRLKGFKGPLNAEKFANGQSNPTFLITTPYRQYVLRRKPPGQLLKSAHAVDREFRVLQALQNTPVPSPYPYCLCDDDSVIGSMFYVMSYEEGRIFWDAALPELRREERSPILLEMVRVLAAIHDVDVGAVGLGDYGKPGNYFERQLHRWTQQYYAAETETLEAVETLRGWLATHLPPDDGQVSLIHGDYRLDNVIFRPAGPEALAVLDWELSTLGHPMADLAHFCMCLRLPSMGSAMALGGMAGLGGLDRRQAGVPGEAQIISHYCQLRNVEKPAHWNFYLAFSFFRMAAIAQGVLKRAMMGNASNEWALRVGRMAGPLAQMAVGLIEQES